ncbi:UbiA family prenyltransferase [Lysobacter korlensis]|uniref:UbiA family prenyltransferase n=1 Tax=Lysobacter korlensis TaxID=553636 RepID=A0ABV6RMP7_9GAMM
MRWQPRSLALATHPGPTVAVTLIVVVLAAGVGLDPWRIALLGAVLLLNQLSVGLSNDWLDAERDRAVGRTDKPVALGLVPASAVRLAAFATAGMAVILSILLGPAAALAHAVFLAAGWSYNLGLKRTPLSVLPYGIGFGTLPAVVTLSAEDPRGAAWWAIGAGAALGVAAHFANVLPDLEDDARTGIRGLPHRLGRAPTEAITWIALVAAAALVALGNAARSPVAIAGLVAVVVIAVVGVAVGRSAAARGGPATRLSFRLILAAAVLVVLLLALDGDAILA